MNQVVEKPFKIAPNKHIEGLERFVGECVRENKEAVLKAMRTMNGIDQNYIIESFVFKILTMIYEQKSKKEIIEGLAGMFKLKDMLVDGFNEEINQSNFSNLKNRNETK